MRTEIERRFSFGFVLSEQDLRRIVQSCNEHARKLNPASVKQAFSAKLRDGALVETEDLEDILSLENLGAKAVERLLIGVTENAKPPSWEIKVLFQDGMKNRTSWDSVELRVVGKSRDWAFLAAAELDERVKKTKTIAWSALLGSRMATLAVMVCVMLAMVAVFPLTQPADEHGEAASALEDAQKSGSIPDPIAALVFLERYHGSHLPRPSDMMWPMLAAVSSPALVFFFVGFVLPRMYPSYNFYWGDYIGIFDKRRALIRGIWTLVVLGVAVSVIGGLILRSMFG